MHVSFFLELLKSFAMITVTAKSVIFFFDYVYIEKIRYYTNLLLHDFTASVNNN